jgi:light-regulated signal transduction histidine kinase (bacteriophytochrome)
MKIEWWTPQQFNAHREAVLYPPRSMPIDTMVTRALWARELEVFLRRRTRSHRSGSAVIVEFETNLEAEQFQKLMLSRRGIAIKPNHQRE